jgi:hypothetical protein
MMYTITRVKQADLILNPYSSSYYSFTVRAELVQTVPPNRGLSPYLFMILFTNILYLVV